jgi:hypothetical protein
VAAASFNGGAGTTAINGGSITTTGTQTYNGAVTLGANTTFATDNNHLVFGGTLNPETIGVTSTQVTTPESED